MNAISTKSRHPLAENLVLAGWCIIVLWALLLLNMLTPYDFRQWGIQPRTIAGLKGIIFCPLLHANWKHLAANTVVLYVMLVLTLSYSRSLAIGAIIVIWWLGGGLVWLFARAGTVHIGASGLIFGLISYMIFSGIFRREWRAILLSLLVLFLYGGTLLAVFQLIPGVSWSSHFYGAVAGIIAAWWQRTRHR